MNESNGFVAKNMEKLKNTNNYKQEKFISRRMVIKIGSSSITKDGNPLNLKFMDSIARQSATMFHSGVEVVIVSSGAVESGRQVVPANGDMTDKQVAAMYGQGELIYRWKEAFARYSIHAAELLLTKRDLKNSTGPLLRAMQFGVVIINENDAVNNEELKELIILGDNDKLASRVARIPARADTLLLLTDTAGVLDGRGNTIHLLDKTGREKVLFYGKSKVGSGGMQSKVKAGFKAAKQGVRTVIASAYEDDVILKVAREENVGTKLITQK